MTDVRLTLTPKAREDLDGIWRYSTDRWGVTKAEAYVRLIAEALDMLARDLRGGMRADHVRPGYFRHLIGSHVVFYRFPHDGVLEVVRILHQCMDVARHLQRVIQAPDVWPPPALSGKRTMFQAFRQGRCDL